MATLQVCAVEACACVRPPARGNRHRSFFFFFAAAVGGWGSAELVVLALAP